MEQADAKHAPATTTDNRLAERAIRPI